MQELHCFMFENLTLFEIMTACGFIEAAPFSNQFIHEIYRSCSKF